MSTQTLFVPGHRVPLTREPLPAPLSRDPDAVRAPRTRLASERPASIREALLRWLDQEL